MVSNAIFSLLRKRPILILLTFLFLLFNVLLNYFLSSEYALDLKFAYSVDQAYESISNLSKPDRELYKFGILALDFPYMIVYGLLGSGLSYCLWRNKKIVLIPIAIVFFDLLENILIINILNNFPEEKPLIAIMASTVTTFKWITVGLLFLSFLIGGLRSINFKRKKTVFHFENQK
jgi:hypothetical protein